MNYEVHMSTYTIDIYVKRNTLKYIYIHYTPSFEMEYTYSLLPATNNNIWAYGVHMNNMVYSDMRFFLSHENH